MKPFNETEYATDFVFAKTYQLCCLQIQSANFDGTNVRKLAPLLVSPMAITVLDNYVYYSDLGLELIERADKENGQYMLSSRSSGSMA